MKRMTAVDKTTETQAVVNLTCIELATEEDKAYLVDYWAAMFKAKTASDKEVARLRACCLSMAFRRSRRIPPSDSMGSM